MMSGTAPKRVPILLYHAVGAPGVAGANEESAFYAVSPEAFEEQMGELVRRGCRTVSLDEVARWIAGTGALPERALVITFDDGDITQATTAAPILQRHGFRAAFFVTAGRVGQPGMMGSQALRRLREIGMTIGSHGFSHRLLTTLSPEAVREELVASKRRLEELVGGVVEWFAFPGGAWRRELLPLVEEATYVGAVTSEAGYATRRSLRAALPRFVVRHTDGVGRLAAVVEGAPGFLARERAGQRALRLVRGVIGMERYERMKRRLVR